MKSFTFALVSILASVFQTAHSQTSISKADEINQYASLEAVSSELVSKADNLNPSVLKLALRAYSKAMNQGIVKKSILTVVDYSLPSTEKRMWIFDINNKKLLFNGLVAHGKGNGDKYVTHVSDATGSLASPVGLYVTEDPYYGANGYSLNIRGLDYGFNEKALDRRIVFHGAWYVSPEVIKQRGSLGRSWGCFAVEDKYAKPIINTIKNKSAVFAYFPDRKWLKSSKYLRA